MLIVPIVIIYLIGYYGNNSNSLIKTGSIAFHNGHGGLCMEKNKLITVVICCVFIVFSGIFYIKTGTGGNESNFIKSTEENISTKDSEQDETPQEQEIEDLQEIAVYICGAVKHPGVYSFVTGKRLCDAIKAAGGFKKSAARSAVNLARRLSDSEQIIIPTKKQAASSKNKNPDSSYETVPSLVNINTASKEELMTLPGIGESKAAAVIEYRLSNKFNSIEDIKNVVGIKDGVFSQIKDQITV